MAVHLGKTPAKLESTVQDQNWPFLGESLLCVQQLFSHQTGVFSDLRLCFH